MSSYVKTFSQFLRKGKIEITILNVKDPSHFIVKESPNVSKMSEDGNRFLELQQEMQVYYSSIDPVIPLSICKNSIVVAQLGKAFHRAEVIRVINSTRGLKIGVYLLDNGTEHQVERDRLYQLEKRFEAVPFQAIDFKLLGLQPMTLLVDPSQLTCSSGFASEWDESAQRYVRLLVEGITKAEMEVYGIADEVRGETGKRCLFGTLYMMINSKLFCLNDELVQERFAAFNQDLLESIISVDSFLQVDNDDIFSSTGKKPKSEESEKIASVEEVDANKILEHHLHAINQIAQGGFVERENETSHVEQECDRKHNGVRREKTLENGVNSITKSCSLSPTSPMLLQKQATACDIVSISGNQPKMDLRQKLFKFRKKPGNADTVSPPSNQSRAEIFKKLIRFQEKNSPRNEFLLCDNTLEINKKKVESLQALQKESFDCKDQRTSQNEVEFDECSNKQLSFSSKEESSKRFISVSEECNLISREASACDADPDLSSGFIQKKTSVCEPRNADIRQKLLNFQRKKPPAKDENSNQKSHCNENGERFHNSESMFSSNTNNLLVSTSQCADRVLEDIKKDEPPSQQNKAKTRNLKDVLRSFGVPKKASDLPKQSSERADSSSDLETTIDEFIGTGSANAVHSLDKLSDFENGTDDSDDVIEHVTSKLKRKVDKNSFSDNGNSCTSEKMFMPRLHADEFEPYFKTDMNYSDKSLWERLEVPALCLGEDIPNPVLQTEKAPFASNLCKILDEVNFRGPSCIQSVVWPAMFRNRSLVAVAPLHSGKTLAYLLPLLSGFIQSGYDYLPSKNGPILIVLCSSWQKVQEVRNHCHLFLRDRKVKVFSLFHDGSNKRGKEMSLVNGCDILISTPAPLVEMLESSATNFERCCHLILDDGNNLMKDLVQLTDVMKLFAKAVEQRMCVSFNIQIVLCVERWTKHVSSFIRTFLLNPLMFFTSFLESAIYAQIPISAHVCKEAEKNRTLLGLLENAKKVVICISDIETGSGIHNFLKHEGMRVFFVNEALEHYNADGVLRSWKAMQSTYSASCLVITDAALIKMSVSNANCLIHYDVPEVSRLQFGHRFGCIAEHFSDMSDKEEADCICHIIVSDDCSVQVPSLVKILSRNGCKIPQELKALKLKHLQAMKDASVSLCHYFKAFGSCNNPQCEFRHHVDSSADKPSAVVCEGDIQALVTHIFDASHFCVRVLKYISPATKETLSLSSRYADVGFQLKDFYSNPSNQIRVKSPSIGKTYILAEKNGLFYRVKILELDNDTTYKRKKVKMLYLDDGYVKQHDFATFYEPSKNLQLTSPLAVEVYLCNIETSDSCSDWNPHASRYVSNLIMGKIIMGKIVLCLGETLWLHPIVLREKLPNLQEHLNVMRLDNILKSDEYAKENKKHLTTLFKACENKIPKPNLIAATVSHFPEDVIKEKCVNFAFLECGEQEEVYVSYVNTPHQFYVQRAKFADILDDMVDEINETMEKELLEKQKPLQKGIFCIAPFCGDNRLYRAIVTKISNGNVGLFYLDFGDTGCVPEDEIYTIPDKFLLLPFQAIECELDGICALHGGFSQQASNRLSDLTRDAAGDMMLLQLKALTKTARYDGGHHYVVDMLIERKSLSDTLIEEGLVSCDEKLNFQETPAAQVEHPDPIIPEEPSGYAISDDEMLSDEKDAAALFCGVLSGLITHQEAIMQSRKKREESTAKPCKKSEIVSITEYQEKESQPPACSTQASAGGNSAKCFKPRVVWWNTVKEVHMSILLKNLQLYDFKSYDDKFTFSACEKEKVYKLEEVLYSQIIATETRTECDSTALKIIFEKKVSEKWPTLTKDNKKRHIKYDPNHIDLGSDSEEDGRLLNFEAYSWDEESEETTGSSADDHYVPTWQKASEYKDPYNLFE